MDYTVDVRMGLEYLIERSRYSDIDIVKFGLLAAYELDATESFLGRVVKVVGYDDLVVCFEKS